MLLSHAALTCLPPPSQFLSEASPSATSLSAAVCHPEFASETVGDCGQRLQRDVPRTAAELPTRSWPSFELRLQLRGSLAWSRLVSKAVLAAETRTKNNRHPAPHLRQGASWPWLPGVALLASRHLFEALRTLQGLVPGAGDVGLEELWPSQPAGWDVLHGLVNPTSDQPTQPMQASRDRHSPRR